MIAEGKVWIEFTWQIYVSVDGGVRVMVTARVTVAITIPVSFANTALMPSKSSVCTYKSSCFSKPPIDNGNEAKARLASLGLTTSSFQHLLMVQTTFDQGRAKAQGQAKTKMYACSYENVNMVRIKR